MNSLAPLDYIAVLLYFGAVLFVGWYASRRQKTTADYFIASGRLPGWAVAFSIVGTVISSVSFVGFPGAAFAEDWRLLVPNLTVPFVLLIVTFVVVPFYRRVVQMSSYEYLERRFGYGARVYGSIAFLILRTVDLGFTLLLTGIAVEVITGWDIRYVVVFIGLFTIGYTLLGGIEGVVWNDVLQGIVLGTGAVLILCVLLFQPKGGPLLVLSTAWQHGKMSLGDWSTGLDSIFSERPTVLVFVFAGFTHFGRAYMIEQNMVQRYLLARSDAEAQRATFIGASTCVLIWIGFSLIGSCLWAYYRITGAALDPAISSKPDNMLPYFAATHLPAGVVGMILAAILAAAMQAFSADLTSIATVATQDYFARLLPRVQDQARLIFGRLAVLFGGLAAVGVALHYSASRQTAMYGVFVLLSMVLAGGTLGLFALGFLTRRANARGAYFGMAACIVFTAWAAATGPMKVNLKYNFPLNPLLIGLSSHLVLFVFGYLASLLPGGLRKDLEGLTVWGRHADRLTRNAKG